MPAFEADVLASWTGGRWSGVPGAAPVGFSADSRRIAPGQAFVALKTAKRDGHDFLGAARDAGATAAVVARIVPGSDLPQLVVDDPLSALQAIAREHRRIFRGRVVGITGSAGKTSTKELLSLLLGGEAEGVLSTEGNLNNYIGVALTLTRIDPQRHRIAVVEAGISAPGEMATLAAMIEPDVALITVVTPAHLSDLGALEAVASEKAVLAQRLRPGGTAIFPSSCKAFAAFRELPVSSCAVATPVAQARGNPARANRVPFSVVHSGEGTRVTLVEGGNEVGFALRRVTDGMAQNAALALLAALRLGAGVPEIRGRLRSWGPSPLRGEWRTGDGQRLYLDCYNANPASMSDALGMFDAVAPRSEPRLFVLGCMEELGRDARMYHVELGRSLKLRSGDRLVAVGGLADAIREGALEAGCEPGQADVSETVDAVAPAIAAFRGWIFVKGSRRHQLETAFASSEIAEPHHA